MTRIYLAYGSNLHPRRLRERLPSSRLLGITRLRRYSVTFDKQSIDGSGKCRLWFSDNPDDIAYGAVYEIAKDEKALLDRIEGLGKGYNEAHVEVKVNGEAFTAFTYFASPDFVNPDLRPYEWYKALVLEGARYHAFPDSYVERLNSIGTRADPDAERGVENENLLLRLRDHQC